MMGDRWLLEVKNARRSFGEQKALAGVSLALPAGEIYALLGRNGAGKSTLIRAICGRVRLDTGTVFLNGADPRRDSTVRRGLGLVPQDVALYPDLTARENLEVFGRLAGLGCSEAKAAAVRSLEWTGLANRAQSLVKTLSGGMKRRINLAAGVLHDPRVLLLDEPTVGVDPQAREMIHELLLDLRRRGLAVVLTTHDLDQAALLADRIGIIDEGLIKAEGTLASLVAGCFAGARQVRLMLGSEPEAAPRSGLEQLGLSPDTRDPRLWSGKVPGAQAALPVLGERFAALGLQPLELMVREPDLYSVFFQVTGKELVE